MDNALDAVAYVDETERWIHIGIKCSKGRLFVAISNAFDGTVIHNEKGIVSRKDRRCSPQRGVSPI